MEILPLFPSNLVVNNLDSKFNTIDIKNINYKFFLNLLAFSS